MSKKQNIVITEGFQKSYVYLEEALKNLIIGDLGNSVKEAGEDFDWETNCGSIVHNPETGEYLIWSDGSNGEGYYPIKVDTGSGQKVEYVGASDYENGLIERSYEVAGQTITYQSYPVEPNTYYIFTNDIVDELCLCFEELKDGNAVAGRVTENYEYHGRFTATTTSDRPFVLDVTDAILPDKYTELDPMLESGHMYEFHVSGGYMLITDITTEGMEDASGTNSNNPGDDTLPVGN